MPQRLAKNQTKVFYLASPLLASLLLTAVFFVFAMSFIPAQTISANSSDTVKNGIIEQKKQEIKKLEEEIREKETFIKRKESQNFSYKNHIEILNEKISKNQKELARLALDIESKDLEIDGNKELIRNKKSEITHEKSIMSVYMRDLYRYDRTDKISLVINTNGFSDFFNQVNYLKNINTKTLSIKNDLDDDRTLLEKKEEELEGQMMELEMIKSNSYSEQANLKSQQREKDALLARNEKEIQSISDANAAVADARNKIQQELFALTREGQSIQFKEAAEYAKFSSEKTGVRAAFIMAIVKVETDFGINVGNGYYKTDMHPEHHEAFIKICKKLGKNPEDTKVSKKPSSYRGWGGAMGIAQFMPREWLGIEAEVAKYTGHNPPSPWEPIDAFTAIGVKMRGHGADRQTRDAEMEAAGRYFAGGNWRNYMWYPNRVLEKAAIYEEQLKSL